MRACATTWPDVRIVQRTVARLSWVEDPETRLDRKASLPTIKEIEAELACEESLSSSDKGEA